MNQPSGEERNGIKLAHAGKPFTSEDVAAFQDPRPHEGVLEKMVKEHNLAVDKLTESQLVECIRQMIASGDFVKYVATSYDPVKAAMDMMPFNKDIPPDLVYRASARQSVVYIPFRESEQLKARIKELEERVEILNDEM